MVSTFKNSLYFNRFIKAREWRNGRRAGLRIQCRKAWGFKSPLSHLKLDVTRGALAGLRAPRSFVCGYCSGTSSTRRFCARPSALSLVATKLVLP